MKKTTKGAIAAGAAALLLAGGAGTMAAWSDSASLGSDSTVTAGKLTITEDAGGAWTWKTPGVTGTFNPGSDLIVPGDIVEYTSTYTIGATGNNLVAKLTPNLQNVGGDLLQYLSVTGSSDTSGVTLNNITEEDDGETITVVTTITFKGDTMNKDGQGLTADLSGATVTLEQTAPASN